MLAAQFLLPRNLKVLALESGMICPVDTFQQVFGSGAMHRLQCSGLHIIIAIALGVRQVEVGQRKFGVIHEKLCTGPDPVRAAHVRACHLATERP